MKELFYNDKFVFSLIPKCASTSLRETLPQHGYKQTHDVGVLNGQQKIAIIREPLDRFLTAFITVTLLSASNYYDKDDLLGDFVYQIFKFKRGNSEYHYMPQSDFIIGEMTLLNFYDLDKEWEDLATGIKLPVANKCKFPNELATLSGYLKRHWELTGLINAYYEEDIKLWQTNMKSSGPQTQ